MADEPAAPVPQETPGAPPAETPAEAGSEPKSVKTPEEYEAELAKVKKENYTYRTKLREVEPIVKEAEAAKEAKKDDVQRAIERADAAEKREKETLQGYDRLELAVQYHIEKADIDLIGSGSREEMEVRAKRVAALSAAASKAAPPPTDRPVEGLRPGATPEPAKPPDDSYPAGWTPKYLRDKDSRSLYGQ